MFYIFIFKLLKDIHKSLFRSFLLAIPIFFVLLWIARTGRAKPVRRPWHLCIKAAGLALALAAILAMTLLNREIGAYSKSFELDFLWSYRAALFKGNLGLAAEILENILLFIPLGFMLPVFFSFFERARHTVLAGLLLSATVELIQGFTAMGLFEFDDIFNNTMGTLVGFFLWAMIKKIATIYHST